MAVKNTYLGGSDWGAEDLYYQDLNDTITRVAQISKAPQFATDIYNSHLLPNSMNCLVLGPGSQDSVTNMTEDEVLKTTTTGSYSVVMPEVKLRKSFQSFLVNVNGLIGSTHADYDAALSAVGNATVISNVSLYPSIHFGFNLYFDSDSANSVSGGIYISDGTNHVALFSQDGLTSSNRNFYSGNMSVWFDDAHDTAYIRVDYQRSEFGGSQVEKHTRYDSIDISSVTGTPALVHRMATETGDRICYLETYGGVSPSDNDFDDFATISLSTDGGSTWGALSGNGIPVTATAAGSTVKVKIEGSAAANDEKLVLRDVTIIPVA